MSDQVNGKEEEAKDSTQESYTVAQRGKTLIERFQEIEDIVSQLKLVFSSSPLSSEFKSEYSFDKEEIQALKRLAGLELKERAIKETENANERKSKGFTKPLGMHLTPMQKNNEIVAGSTPTANVTYADGATDKIIGQALLNLILQLMAPNQIHIDEVNLNQVDNTVPDQVDNTKEKS